MSDQPGDELVEILGPDGSVTSIASREEMRRCNLWHRSTYVAVVRQDLRLVVHQRAPWKDVAANAWDLFFGGVCGVEEPWELSATRELAEEAGLVISSAAVLESLGSFRFENDQTRVHGRVYLVRSEDPVTCPDGEVVAVEEVPLSEIANWCALHEVCSDSLSMGLPLVLDHLGSDLKRL